MSFNFPLHPLQIGQHLGCALVAKVPIFLQSLFDDCLHAERKIGIQPGGRNGIVLKNRAEYYGGALAPKWQRASRHFVEHRAKRKQISTRVQFPRTGLFRRHICNRAERRPWAGEVVFIDLTQGSGAGQAGGGNASGSHFGETEIENLRVSTLGDENVPRFDIAVDDA